MSADTISSTVCVKLAVKIIDFEESVWLVSLLAFGTQYVHEQVLDANGIPCQHRVQHPAIDILQNSLFQRVAPRVKRVSLCSACALAVLQC